jgi:hypothetical protein
MSLQFQIVFKGQLLEGFELAVVKANAARRLKATPEQVDRLFSGKRAVLKKSLPDDVAQRYASELKRIGMLVAIEPEAAKAPAPAAELVTHDPIGEIAIASTPPPPRSEPQRVTSRDEPEFDPMKTQIADVAEGLEPPPPERWSQPTIAISQKHLSSTQPTIAVESRSSASAAEPTIVVTRGSASHSSAQHDASSEPTLIVPPRRSKVADHDSSAPTLIVPPRRSAASDPTMIVPPRQSAASQPTIIVRSNQTLPTTEAGFDSEKTQLANTDAAEEYESPEAELPAAQRTPAPRTLFPAAPSATAEEVQCPTCGDKQPKRVYCRRCGHALSLPPKPAPMGESTITKKTFTPVPKPPAVPVVSEETVLVSEHDEPETKSAAKKNEFLAAPTWFTIGLMFVLLLAVAGWLLFA